MLSFGHDQGPASHPRTLLLLLSVFMLAACGTDIQAPPASSSPVAATVAAWSVQTHELATQRQWHGRMEPLRLVAVHAAGQGQIAELNVREGDRVRQGDILLRIHAPELQSRRAVLLAQQQVLNDQLQRWEKLIEREGAAQNDLVQARIQLLEVDEQLAQLEAEINRHMIRAPVPGQVSGVTLDTGNNVSAGQVLLTVQDENAWGVRLAVPARESVLLGAISRLRLLTESGGVLPLDRIIVTAGTAAGIVNAEVYVEPRPDWQAREVTLHYDETGPVLLVPWTAVASDERGTWVALIEGSPATINRRIIQLGRAHAAGVEVVDGLNEGDLVVRYEPRSLPEGREVTPRIAQP